MTFNLVLFTSSDWGLSISIATVNKMNPRPHERILPAAVKHITLHLYATAKYPKTQKLCQIKIINVRLLLFLMMVINMLLIT